jgi:hypothetical protein
MELNDLYDHLWNLGTLMQGHPLPLTADSQV